MQGNDEDGTGSDQAAGVARRGYFGDRRERYSAELDGAGTGEELRREAVRKAGGDMSYEVWCEIVCPNCGATVGGRFFKRHIRRVAMTKAARSKGWTRDSADNNWRCGPCTQAPHRMDAKL